MGQPSPIGGFDMPWNRGYDFVNGNIANGDEVDTELNTLFGAVNSLDASKASLGANTFTNFQTLHANPQAGSHAANKQYVDSQLSALSPSIAAKVSKGGDQMTGDLILRMIAPTIRMIGQEGGGREFYFREAAGNISIYRNDGPEASPSLVEIFRFNSTGDPAYNSFDVATKAYVNQPNWGFNNIVKADGEFTTSETNFTDVPGLSVAFNLIQAKRITVSLAATVKHSSGGHVFVDALIDGAHQGGSKGIVRCFCNGPGQENNASFSFDSQQIPAGSHSASIRMRVDTGSGTLIATPESTVRFSIRETPFP
jgi:hypothetical protein